MMAEREKVSEKERKKVSEKGTGRGPTIVRKILHIQF